MLTRAPDLARIRRASSLKSPDLLTMIPAHKDSSKMYATDYVFNIIETYVSHLPAGRSFRHSFGIAEWQERQPVSRSKPIY
ncbi:MAG: hypothetical protein C4576_28115 [Desulfobacteraceae bacterium]|nr:MAG: hypothetical protein C4576_28115 [Desulfobacteraceae bacterium]